MMNQTIDVTPKYQNMISAFQCDFSLANEYPKEHSLADLDHKIQGKDPNMLQDICLLEELEYNIRCGRCKIVEKKENKLVACEGNQWLYRAKRTDNGEWVIGTLIIFETFAYIMETYNTYIRAYYDGGDCVDFDMRAYRVDKSTICRYIGAKDKNGTLIWEHDILVGHLDEHYPEDATYAQVIWNGYGFYTKEQGSADIHLIDTFTESNYEVCGNIFDNQELLEAEDNE